jgi:hypothetical protein
VLVGGSGRWLMPVGVAVIGADRLEGLPGDAQDHERDCEADERVGDLEAERDGGRGGDDGEGDVAVGTGVVAVGDERGAAELASGAQADLSGDLVADEPDGAGGGERGRESNEEGIDRAMLAVPLGGI